MPNYKYEYLSDEIIISYDMFICSYDHLSATGPSTIVIIYQFVHEDLQTVVYYK